jgi:hypothetical protein
MLVIHISGFDFAVPYWLQSYASNCDLARTGRTGRKENYSGVEVLTAITLLVVNSLALVPVDTRSRLGWS